MRTRILASSALIVTELAAVSAGAEPSGTLSRDAIAVVRSAGEVGTAPGRVFSKGATTWVWAEPSRRSAKLGYVRVGTAVALRSAARSVGPGCPAGFVPVQPRGYVCLDRTSTLDRDDRYLRSMQLVQPGAGPLPFRYALSNGAPMYRRLPSAAEVRRAERFLGRPGSFRPLSWGNRGHEELAEVRTIAADSPLPFFLERGGSAGTDSPLGLVRRRIPLGSMLAYTRTFEHDGRVWLLSTDGTIVPADRVRPFRASKFAGVELGAGTELPIAWMRRRARPKYVRGEDGSFRPAGGAWPVRTFTRLDGSVDPENQGGRTFLATREAGESGTRLFIDERDATVVRRRETLPFSVSKDDRWLVVRITAGTLVAYEGTRPVFATLVSPGVGGVPLPGRDPLEASTTPMGVFRVTYKHRAATMSPETGENRSFWIADVPYTQYFHAPFALHVAYWHERFGEGMSAGCINLSPADGKWLFDWTEPHVPEGWNGARAGSLNGPGTFVVVVR